jgi:hypothetical protein
MTFGTPENYYTESVIFDVAELNLPMPIASERETCPEAQGPWCPITTSSSSPLQSPVVAALPPVEVASTNGDTSWTPVPMLCAAPAASVAEPVIPAAPIVVVGHVHLKRSL